MTRTDRKFFGAACALLLIGALLAPVLASPFTIINSSGHHAFSGILAQVNGGTGIDSSTLTAYQLLQMNSGATALAAVSPESLLAHAGADIAANSHKITNLANGSASTDALAVGQLAEPIVGVGTTSAICLGTDMTPRYILAGQTAAALSTSATPFGLVPAGAAHINKMTVRALANTLANGATVAFTIIDFTASANKSTKTLNAASSTTAQTDLTQYAVSAGDELQLKCQGSGTGSGGQLTGYLVQLEFGI